MLNSNFLAELPVIAFFKRLFALLLFVLTVSGCASTSPVLMEPSILDEPDASFLIVTTQYTPSGKMFRKGAQGLLDIAINSAVTAPVSNFLATKNGAEFDAMVDKIEQELERRNIAVSRYDRPIDYSALPKRKTVKGEFNKDLSSIFSQTDAKYVLFLRLVGYGAERAYFGFLPASSPEGVVYLDGAIVDRSSNLQWAINESTSLTPRFIKAVDGKWNEPPNYPSLDQALTDSWQKAEDGVITDIFGAASVSAN